MHSGKGQAFAWPATEMDRTTNQKRQLWPARKRVWTSLPGMLGGGLVFLGVCTASGLAGQETNEVAELKRKAAAQEAIIRDLLEWKKSVEAGGPRASQPALAASTNPATEASEPASEAAGERTRFPTIQFRGFGDISYVVNDRRDEHNSFALGQLDLFLTSQLAEDLDVLGELVVESRDDNAFATEIERLQLNYRPSDYFNVAAGRYHTAIGYYNTAFHHGAWLQTAVGRPRIFGFEDDDGVLPIHNVGLSVSGQIPSGPLGLHYVFEVGNGRHYGATAEPVLNVADDNDHKAVNLGLTARPDGVPGLQLGVSAYHDTATPDGLPRLDQLIVAGHVVWQRPKFEWFNEVFWFRHAPAGGSATHAVAAYSQVARQWGRVRPLFRYQYTYAQRADVIFSNFGEPGLTHGPSVGLRYDFSALAALKFQYDHWWQSGGRSINQFTTQVVFTF